MKTINALLVDDEYLALKLLEDYIGKLPEIHIVDKIKTPLQAIEIINSNKIDLLFLDVQMPAISGTGLLKTLKYQPLTIFTTAHAEYAVQAYDLNVIDYLLKPYSFDRFLQAVNKAKELLADTTQASGHTTNDTACIKNYLCVKSNGKIVRIGYDNILFIEGLKEYVKIVCIKGYFVTLESLRNLEEMLPASKFVRVHKSYIVAIDKISALYGNMLEIGEHNIPVSREKKDDIVRIVFR